MKIISPAQFKTARWKNGNGETTELAASGLSSSDDVDWRLSKAVVAEDGEFSASNGYQRHLMLL